MAGKGEKTLSKKRVIDRITIFDSEIQFDLFHSDFDKSKLRCYELNSGKVKISFPYHAGPDFNPKKKRLIVSNPDGVFIDSIITTSGTQMHGISHEQYIMCNPTN